MKFMTLVSRAFRIADEDKVYPDNQGHRLLRLALVQVAMYKACGVATKISRDAELATGKCTGLIRSASRSEFSSSATE